MTTRVLVIGDLHVRAAALRETEALAASLLALLARERFTFVVVTGDVLHEHAYVHTAALNAAIELLLGLSRLAGDGLYVLIGNHDLPSNQVFLEPRHAFNALKGRSGLEVVDTVKRRGPFVFVPYVPPGRFVEALETGGGDWRTAQAIFAHQEFRGARHGVFESVAGDVWPAGAPLVISGHYHRHQWLRDNLCYVGTPVAHDFSEVEAKTVSAFTFGPEGRAVEERIDLGLPGRRTVEVTLADVEAGRLPEPGRDLVRLIVAGEPHALLAFRKSAAFRAVSAGVHKVVLRSSLPVPALRGREGGSYMELLARYAGAEGPLVQKILEEVVGRAREARPLAPAPLREASP